MNNFFYLIALVILLGGCAAPAQRNADGNPRLERIAIPSPLSPEEQARETARLTREADDAAAKREEARRNALYRDYYYDPYPYWGRFYPYAGYGSWPYRSGWYGGVGWGW